MKTGFPSHNSLFILGKPRSSLIQTIPPGREEPWIMEFQFFLSYLVLHRLRCDLNVELAESLGKPALPKSKSPILCNL